MEQTEILKYTKALTASIFGKLYQSLSRSPRSKAHSLRVRRPVKKYLRLETDSSEEESSKPSKEIQTDYTHQLKQMLLNKEKEILELQQKLTEAQLELAKHSKPESKPFDSFTQVENPNSEHKVSSVEEMVFVSKKNKLLFEREFEEIGVKKISHERDLEKGLMEIKDTVRLSKKILDDSFREDAVEVGGREEGEVEEENQSRDIENLEKVALGSEWEAEDRVVSPEVCLDKINISEKKMTNEQVYIESDQKLKSDKSKESDIPIRPPTEFRSRSTIERPITPENLSLQSVEPADKLAEISITPDFYSKVPIPENLTKADLNESLHSLLAKSSPPSNPFAASSSADSLPVTPSLNQPKSLSSASSLLSLERLLESRNPSLHFEDSQEKLAKLFSPSESQKPVRPPSENNKETFTFRPIFPMMDLDRQKSPLVKVPKLASQNKEPRGMLQNKESRVGSQQDNHRSRNSSLPWIEDSETQIESMLDFNPKPNKSKKSRPHTQEVITKQKKFQKRPATLIKPLKNLPLKPVRRAVSKPNPKLARNSHKRPEETSKRTDRIKEDILDDIIFDEEQDQKTWSKLMMRFRQNPLIVSRLLKSRGRPRTLQVPRHKIHDRSERTEYLDERSLNKDTSDKGLIVDDIEEEAIWVPELVPRLPTKKEKEKLWKEYLL